MLTYFVSFCGIVAASDILLRQSCAKILVGDPHQQIYAFRGARNALQEVTSTHTFYLTQVGCYWLNRNLTQVFFSKSTSSWRPRLKALVNKRRHITYCTVSFLSVVTHQGSFTDLYNTRSNFCPVQIALVWMMTVKLRSWNSVSEYYWCKTRVSGLVVLVDTLSNSYLKATEIYFRSELKINFPC